MYVIRKAESGDKLPSHGKFFKKRDAAQLWMYRECYMDTGAYFAKPDRYKDDFRCYEDEHEELGGFRVFWEDESVQNEFGLVLP
jgi:hypothetical protein